VNIFIATVMNDNAVLRPDESWHCAKVLRKKAGDLVSVIDGNGNMYRGTLELVNERSCTVRITEGPLSQPARSYRLHLMIAPTKQLDRIEWMLEKAVEIGVDEVTFVQCRNSERTVVKADRMVRIVESAVKQSLQASIPIVNEMVAFKDALLVPGDQKYVGYCGEAASVDIADIDFRKKNSVILIGPEGDFTPDEYALALKHGFSGLRLGPNRLRTETAGLYAVQAAALLSAKER
jgi:16S rRNA (uracil1498-N3)-methyltransferase